MNTWKRNILSHKRVASSYVIFMFTSILCDKVVTGHNKEYSRMLSKEQEVPHQFACNEIIVSVGTTTSHGSRQTKWNKANNWRKLNENNQ